MSDEALLPATGSVADAYPPPEIAARVCKLGLAKVNTAVPTMVALAVLAGAFISLGALFYTVTITAGTEGPTLPFGLLRLAGGVTFSLGLILVVVGGAELFTGNNLIAMAWAAGCVAPGPGRRMDAAGIPHRHVWTRFRNYLSKPLLAATRLSGHNRKEDFGGGSIGYHEFAGRSWLAWPFLCLQVLDNLFDIWWRYHRSADRRVVVADRCIYDTLVDLAIDTGLDDVVFGPLGHRLVDLLPAPRLVAVLNRPVAAMRNHRPDVLLDRNFARRRALFFLVMTTFSLAAAFFLAGALRAADFFAGALRTAVFAFGLAFEVVFKRGIPIHAAGRRGRSIGQSRGAAA